MPENLGRLFFEIGPFSFLETSPYSWPRFGGFFCGENRSKDHSKKWRILLEIKSEKWQNLPKILLQKWQILPNPKNAQKQHLRAAQTVKSPVFGEKQKWQNLPK